MSEIIIEIESIIERNNGIMSYKNLIEAGVKKSEIQRKLRNRELTLMTYGGYAVKGKEPDDFTVLQSKSDHIVYSNSTALYLLGMINYRPDCLHIKVKNEYRLNLSKVFLHDGVEQTKKNESIRIHYDKTDYYDLGIDYIKTPGGGSVKCYDKERIMCDLIRKKVDVTKDERIKIIKEYFNKLYNKKILDYANTFKITEAVEEYKALCT